MQKKNIILIVAVVLIIGAIYFLQSTKPKHAGSDIPATPVSVDGIVHTADYAAKAAIYPVATEFVSPDGYINSEPFKLSDLIGKKVILVDFWTYSCINCQRTLPYLTAWYNKYKDQGLVIVGVEAPEFEFEKNRDNVVAAAKKYGILYPIIQDNELRTWDAYDNNYWPEEYLIDINGLVVDRKIGEGNYDETEAKIVDLLKERAQVLGEKFTATGTTDITPVAISTESPETYFGYARNEYLTNGNPFKPGNQTLKVPSTIPLNKLYLSGTWNFESESASNVGTPASIFYHYKSSKVYFVASSTDGATVEVYRDGVKLPAQAGTDLDANGQIMIKDARLYTLINDDAMGEHTIEIRVLKGTLNAFTFTFG